MAGQLFSQNIIAMIWDFDKTLIPGYMQEPLFEHYKIDEKQFWAEVVGLEEVYRQGGGCLVSRDTLYLNHLLAYVRNGAFKGLNNKLLKELGQRIRFYEGLPQFFEQVRAMVRADESYVRHGITVEHYVVSTGLRQMILGCPLAPHVDGVWGCEFIGDVPGPGYLKDAKHKIPTMESEFTDIAYSIDHTTKTRAVFEINKGSNKIAEIEVTAAIPREHRRVPFQNMIYIADGPSDISVFSLLNQREGKTFAVYRPGSKREFEQVYRLQQAKRVQSFGEANYTETSQSYLWLTTAVRDIASRIVREHGAVFGTGAGSVAKHFKE